ncbi:MAG: efflux RND transporter periplasmic adaptor subunit [Gammaproteobacteria bacterium]|nr:efflux RND transporter periplasmic adaptor subunit [Gammaproteobacteria bacterium]
MMTNLRTGALSVWMSVVLCVFGVFSPDAKAEPRTAGIRVLLVAHIETTLSSQIRGRIEQLKIKSGESFKRNQTLVKFDCRLYQAQLQKAQAQLLGEQKKHEANLSLQSFKAIGELEVAVSEAEQLQAKADVLLHKVQTSLCEIKAPFRGRIISLHTAPYASVSPGDPLIDILDDTRLEMQLHVPSQWLSWLKKGAKFTVNIDETGRSYHAQVIRLGAKVDPVSQTLEISARVLDKDKHLLAGMSGAAAFELPE